MGVDDRVFFFVNGLGNESLDPVVRVLSIFGAWPVAVVTLAIVATDGARPFWTRHVPYFVCALGLTFAVTAGLKYAIDAPRPYGVFREAIAAGDVVVRFLDEKPPATRALPSGHSMTSALSLVYLTLWRRRWWPFTLLALLVLTGSRVYAGAHFPIDCVAGAALGALGGWAAWQLGKRRGSSGEPSAVRAMDSAG